MSKGPVETFERFALTLQSIRIELSALRSRWDTRGLEESCDRITDCRQRLGAMAREVASNVIVPQGNQTGEQWTLEVMDCADKAISFASAAELACGFGGHIDDIDWTGAKEIVQKLDDAAGHLGRAKTLLPPPTPGDCCKAFATLANVLQQLTKAAWEAHNGRKPLEGEVSTIMAPGSALWLWPVTVLGSGGYPCSPLARLWKMLKGSWSGSRM